MKTIHLWGGIYSFIGCAGLFMVACVPTGKTVNSTVARTPPAIKTTPPSSTSSSIYSSAPQDEVLDLDCRITINFFFSFKQGDSIDAYRNLFLSSSKHLADSRKPPLEALILLELMPASQWWQENYPATPMPNSIIPEKPDEYIYFAKFTGHYEPNETPAHWYPDSMTFTMVAGGSSADGTDSCKIKGYGHG
jgi:hypothetical protein